MTTLEAQRQIIQSILDKEDLDREDRIYFLERMEKVCREMIQQGEEL